MSKFVKCICDCNMNGFNQDGFLVEGKIYEVEADPAPDGGIKFRGCVRSFLRERFVDVEEPLSKEPLSKECACGIFRADCDYHSQA